MASRLTELDLSKPESARTWLIAFNALARSKEWQDTDLTKKIADNFLASCGIAALEKIQFITSPHKLEEMKFKDIEIALLKYLEPKLKLVIAERTKFNSLTQNDESIMDFMIRLRQGVRYCEYDKLKTSADPAEELLLVVLVAGLRDSDVKDRVLDKIQSTPGGLAVDQVVSFVQQFEVRRQFVHARTVASSNQSVAANDDINAVVQRNTNSIKNCNFCGRDHAARKCPAYGKTCTKCSKPNHFASVCRSKVQAPAHYVGDTDDQQVDDIWFANKPAAKNATQSFRIGDKLVRMQIDTGASVSVISSKMWTDLDKPSLGKSFKRLEAYDGHAMKTMGTFTSVLEHNGVLSPIVLTVVDSEKSFGLLGRDILNEVSCIGHIAIQTCVEPLPTIKGVVARMQLVDNAKNVFCAARKVPVALEEKVHLELDRLEQRGIITKHEGGADNASPVVWVKKRNGDLRMCVDFKAHVNAKIKWESYPTPSTEVIFAKLKNAKKFAKIDLTEAYSQIELDDNAKKLSIINTSKGLYTVNRLQMGMKNSQAIFQRAMETILSDLKGVLVYHDDILAFAENDDSLVKRLEAIRTRLQEKRVTINEAKSVNLCDEITYLGFKVSAKGIEPDEALVKKIVDIATPTCKKDVDSFIGLANYFGRLIPNFTDLMAPLNRLRKTGIQFVWDAHCSQAFNLVKKAISSSPVVQPYCLDKDVTLTTDASKEAIGACLVQDDHPVIYISRKLSNAEKNYSNIEREALAVVWAVVRLKHFLLGRSFNICTDHKPLVYLFGDASSIPVGTSARICCWALKLMAYEYTIRYVKGADIPHADALSRMKFKDESSTTDRDDLDTAAVINCVEFEKGVLDSVKVQTELANDKFIQGILRRVRSGRWSNCSQAEKQFKEVASKLTIDENMLYVGTRLFIPPRLREEAFRVCHADNHSGIHSSVQRMRLCAWWPGMAKDIQSMVQRCDKCMKIRPTAAQSVHQWPEAKPLERWHMDWADIGSRPVLIVVDAGSGWIEAFPTANRLSSTVIRCLRTVFTRFGAPVCLVSDNGPELVSDELNDWLCRQGIKKLESPKYFPRANGLAERSVQTVKAALASWKEYKYHSDFNALLQRVLFHHRISSHARGKSPSELLFGKTLRVPIVSSFQQGERLWYRSTNSHESKDVTYVMTKGSNTSYVLEDDKLVLVSNSQIASALQSPSGISAPVGQHSGLDAALEVATTNGAATTALSTASVATNVNEAPEAADVDVAPDLAAMESTSMKIQSSKRRVQPIRSCAAPKRLGIDDPPLLVKRRDVT
jgi:hypothetical protein